MAALQFRDSVECYDAIGRSLADAVTGPWESITVDVVLDGVGVTIIKQYRSPDGQLHDVAFIPMLGECFYRLARLVSTEQEGLFKRCRFVLEPNGKYHSDFEY